MYNEYVRLTESFIRDMAEVDAPIVAYIDALEMVISDLQSALDAAKYDLNEKNSH